MSDYKPRPARNQTNEAFNYLKSLEARNKQVIKITCKSTHIMPSQDKNIIYNGVGHSGVIAHKCILSPNHEKQIELCECECGEKWRMFNEIY